VKNEKIKVKRLCSWGAREGYRKVRLLRCNGNSFQCNLGLLFSNGA